MQALLVLLSRAGAVTPVFRAPIPMVAGRFCASRLRMASTSPRHLIAEIQVLPSPIGTADDQYKHVDAAIAAIAASGLTPTVGALGTTIEGDADEVWAATRSAFDACLASGASSEMMVLKMYAPDATSGVSVDTLQVSGQAAATLAESDDADAFDDSEFDDSDPADDDSMVAMPSVPKTTVIHVGSRELPPLVEVPGGALPLEYVVKPPDADSLWEWYSNRGDVEADPSWASVWPAAANLAYLITREASLVRGKRVAELGSGLGVAGLTAAKKGASTVTLIDREPYALHCAMATAERCGLETGPVPSSTSGPTGANGVVSASVSDWGALAAEGLVVDVVLASEVLYDPAEAAPLAAAAARLLSEGGTLLLADPAKGRAVSARAAAADALKALGATVSEVPLDAAPAGDGWYEVRAGGGAGGNVAAGEAIVLLKAVWLGPPNL